MKPFLFVQEEEKKGSGVDIVFLRIVISTPDPFSVPFSVLWDAELSPQGEAQPNLR